MNIPIQGTNGKGHGRPTEPCRGLALFRLRSALSGHSNDCQRYPNTWIFLLSSIDRLLLDPGQSHRLMINCKSLVPSTQFALNRKRSTAEPGYQKLANPPTHRLGVAIALLSTVISCHGAIIVLYSYICLCSLASLCSRSIVCFAKENDDSNKI